MNNNEEGMVTLFFFFFIIILNASYIKRDSHFLRYFRSIYYNLTIDRWWKCRLD